MVDAIKRPRRYIKLAEETEPYPLPHGNVTWNLPVNVDHNDAEHNSYGIGIVIFTAHVTNSFQDDLKTFDNGSQAAERIAESDLVGGSYKSVKGSVSSSASLKKQFDDKHSWAFYAYVFDVVSIDIDEYLPSLNVEGLKCALNSLPKWDTGTIPEEDTIKEYRDLFATSGTHIITAVNFGSRLELVRSENRPLELSSANNFRFSKPRIPIMRPSKTSKRTSNSICRDCLARGVLIRASTALLNTRTFKTLQRQNAGCAGAIPSLGTKSSKILPPPTTFTILRPGKTQLSRTQTSPVCQSRNSGAS